MHARFCFISSICDWAVGWGAAITSGFWQNAMTELKLRCESFFARSSLSLKRITNESNMILDTYNMIDVAFWNLDVLLPKNHPPSSSADFFIDLLTSKQNISRLTNDFCLTTKSSLYFIAPTLSDAFKNDRRSESWRSDGMLSARLSHWASATRRSSTNWGSCRAVKVFGGKGGKVSWWYVLTAWKEKSLAQN